MNAIDDGSLSLSLSCAGGTFDKTNCDSESQFIMSLLRYPVDQILHHTHPSTSLRVRCRGEGMSHEERNQEEFLIVLQ
jgi:hypothetical protein